MARSALIEVMTRAVIKAARGLRRDFGELEHLQISKKGTSDFVSAADIRSEKILFEELSHARPQFGFLMEEGGEKKGKTNFRWIIDPIDGTTNFIHAVPYFCISVGLEKTLPNGDTEIVAGVIYDPIRDEMFTAEKGEGAFLNERKLRISGRKEVEESLLATGMPRASRPEYERSQKMLSTVTGSAAAVRCWGAAALDLAYVAAGRFDGFWYLNLKPWDVAAGMLMVQEAGGIVTEIGGGTGMLHSGSILATNGQIHKKVDALLTEFA